jgi:SAM-dependent methyltransferase
MRDSIIPSLICPQTHAPLRLKSDRRDDSQIIEGELISAADERVRYPIRGGVPRFAETQQMSDEQRETINTFSFKWSKIPQYANEQATKANRERWYFERFGFQHGDADVKAFLESAEMILEAGAGTGVDTDMLVRNSRGLVFGVDISTAIDEAYRRFSADPRVVLFQADIGQLPFRPGIFDVVSCDQVLHHTPDPRGNFTKLLNLLKPGGCLLLYVYRVKGPLREFSDDHLRDLMIRAPLDECLDFCERITRLGRNLSHLHATVQVEDDIPELGIQRGTQDVQRFVYNSVFKCFWNDDYDFLTNVMVNFDWYRPIHAFRFTESDIRTWASEENLTIERFHIEPSGISAIMRKP